MARPRRIVPRMLAPSRILRATPTQAGGGREWDDLVDYAEQAIAKGSKSFALASKLFDRDTREKVWLLYAWCRRCDDLADNQEGRGAFLVGNHATAPDFHLYELLVQFTALAKAEELPAFLGAFPCLMFFMKAFEALPGNARYMATLGALSPQAIPFNNKMAGFGASLKNATWQLGEEYDFHTLTGIY